MEALTQYQDLALFFLRLVVGIIFIVHGLPKVTKGKEMVKAMGKPQMAPFFTSQGVVEAVGGVLMIAGFYVEIVSIIFAIIMVGAIWLKNTAWKTGFMAHDKTGWEFDLVLLVANLLILTQGAGAISLGI